MSPPKSILVVDDDELSRELLVVMLASEGHDVLGVDSGDAALEMLQADHSWVPDAVVTDLHMPGLCGNELAVELRTLLPDAHLLAVSGRETSLGALSLFDNFLLKPFSSEQLIKALFAPSHTFIAGPGANPDAPVLDEAIYNKLAAGMKPEQLRQFYEFSLQDAMSRFRKMESAAAIRNEIAFVREAHTLQGGCGMIGAMELRAIACALENEGLSAANRLPEISAAIDRLQRILELTV